MKKYQILLFAVVAMAAASCSEKEEFAPAASLDGTKVHREFTTLATKTVLQGDGTTVVWEDADSISVFDGVGNNVFEIKDYTSPSASAKFDGTVDAGATEFYAVYPYAKDNALDGSKLTATVPVTQKAKIGSFDSKAAVAVAYTSDDVLAFHNVTALIGIKLADTQTNVSSIVLTGNSGEYVAGAVSATLASNGSVSAIAPGTGSKSATLSGTFAAGEMYYLAFIPQEFSEGITVTANYSDGKCARLVSSLEWEAVAGKSYNVVDFGTASYLEFEEDRFTFDYGETKTVNFTGVNVASVNSISLPAGWSYAALGANSVQISAPAKSVVVENEAGVVYKPVGDAVISFTSNASAAKSAKTVVRLRGINSDEEFNEFRLAYGNGSASFAASSVSYNRRLTDCADYLVGEEITLNDNVTASSQSGYPFYILHHIEHNLNGNGKTFTMNVSSSAWPAGFCQVLRGDLKIHDINLAGTLNWTYSAAGSSAGCCGGFAGQLSGSGSTAVEFENVNNSVDIVWTSASTADPTKHHSIGGFIGFAQHLTATFKNCTYSGTITKNCRNLAVGGFIGWNSGTNKSYFDGCSFTGTINDNAVSSKSAYTASTNLEFIGGFVGASDGNASALIDVKGCELSGTITVAGGARMVGGFVGKGSCPITFGDNESGTHCVFSGEIDYKDSGVNIATDKVVGLVGGFVGYKTVYLTSFDKCVFSSTGKLTINGGAYSAGGFIGTTDKNGTSDAATFVNCNMEGTFDYTTFESYSSSPTNRLGRIGGFVGELGNDAIVSFSNCNVTSSAKLLCHKDYSNFGGFVGNGGGNSASVTFNNCAFHGLLMHTASTGNGARRMGGFVGDASRIVKLTNCVVDGDLQLHENGKGTVAFGGILGRTTAQSGTVGNPHTMKFDLVDCIFSGTMKVYNPKAETVHGTLIGVNAGYAVTTVDGVVGTSNASINYGTTAPAFLTE